MKNREKYKNKLIDVIKENGRLCDFVKTHGVFRVLESESEYSCEGIYCSSCAVLLQLWLDEECEECEEYEEYGEPKVDWDNVPVDTLVRVRNSKDEEWILQYFRGIYKENPLYKFLTWAGGTTSKTAIGDDHVAWRYCELVENLEEK